MGAPLFILSFRHRDELSRLAEGAGWQPIAARGRTISRRASSPRAQRGGDRRPRRARGGAGGGARGRRRGRGQCRGLARPALAGRRRRARRLSPARRHPFPGQPVHRAPIAPRDPVRPPPCRAGRRRSADDPARRRGGRFLLVALAAGLAHRRAQPRAGPPGRPRRGGGAADQPDGPVPQARSGRPPRRPRRDRPAARHRRGHRLRPWRERRRRIAHHLRRSDRAWSAAPSRCPAAARRAIRSPGCATAAPRAPGSPPSSRRPTRRRPLWSRSCSRSAATTRSTPPSAAPPATRCCRRRRGGSSAMSAPTAGPSWSPGWPAPSSRFCSARRRRSTTAASSPASWSRRSAGRSPRATMSSPSAAAPASPRLRPATIRRAAAPGERGAGRGRRRRVARPRARGRRGERDRARRPARGGPAPRARPRRDRDPFQPQVSVTSGAIVGVEALARWQHPYYGELDAQTLFGVAEGSDYLPQLSDHVQRKAIAAAAAWPEALGRLRLSVNITAADIVRPGFAAQFLAWSGQRLRAGAAHRRGHRERADRGSRRRRRPARRAARRRPAGRDRRFRHRLFEPRLSEGAAARLSEDRQAPGAGHRRLEPRTGSWCARHRHGPLAHRPEEQLRLLAAEGCSAPLEPRLRHRPRRG
jgi:hypothetical protein